MDDMCAESYEDFHKKLDALGKQAERQRKAGNIKAAEYSEKLQMDMFNI